MARHHRGLPAAVTVGLASVLASGCTASPSPAPPAQPSGARAADGSAQPVPPVAAQPRSPTTPEALACSVPSRALLDWAGASSLGHSGPIRASSLVYAASTDTGDWYVLAIDREHVLDDGTLTGDSSRRLALTNAVKPPPEERKLIPISEGSIGKGWKITWDSVSWTGDTLAAGQRAAQRAIQCLDTSQD